MVWTSMFNGLITCERVPLGKGAKVLICGSAQGILHYILEEAEDSVDEQDDGKENGQQDMEGRESKQPHHERMNMTHAMTWNVRCARQIWANVDVRLEQMCANDEKIDVWNVLFLLRRLQQIAINCKRSSSEGIDFGEFSELQQESFHCYEDVLDDEDDKSHFCQKNRCTRQNRCESLLSRLTVKTVRTLIMLHWSLNGISSVIASKCIESDPPILSLSNVLCLRHMTCEIFLRVFVHFDSDFFYSNNFKLRNDRESL